jgi:hypothetical protein
LPSSIRTRLAAAAALGALLLLAAAALAAAEPRHEPAGGPDPVVSVWAEWPHPVSCEGGLAFDPVAAFSGPTDAERGRSAAERALRRYLAQGAFFGLRQHGWRALRESHGVAEFAAGRLFAGSDPDAVPELEWLRFHRTHGRWKWQGYAFGCTPHSIRRGVAAVSWTLAEGQHLGSGTRRVRVDLGPGECDDGASQNARVEKPEFREQNGYLIMTLWLRPVPPGGHTCEGVVEPPLLVQLPEALGDRELFDGGTYPPRAALRPIDAG